MPCTGCGNPEPSVMMFAGKPGEAVETCDECDPFMRCTVRPDFICPYNDIYCMFDYREGHRGGCACWGCDLKDWRGNTKFCWPNRTLIHYLMNNQDQTNRNKLIGILTSEKLMKKFFMRRKIDYEVKIVKVEN